MTPKIDIDRMRVASPCHVGWDSMVGDDRARHCGSCDRHVYNIVGLSRGEIESLVASTEGRLCVRMYQRVDSTVLTEDCPVGLRLIRKRAATFAGAALSALLGLMSNGSAQEIHVPCVRPGSTIERIKIDSQGGQISGTIFDVVGGVVPGVELKLQREKRVVAKATSDSEGKYSMPNIDPAENYILRVESKNGWKKQSFKRITINRGETAIYNLCVETKHPTVIGIFTHSE